MKPITKLWILMVLLVILTPLGLMIPAYFKAGGAWGEWRSDEIEKLAGYVPQGLARLSSIWRAPISGYTFLPDQRFSYLISAIVGVLLVAGIVYLAGRILSKPR